MPEAEARRLLVLDDDYMIATAIADMLEEAGFEVVGPALSVREALRIVRLEQLDGGVLDLQLKGELALPVAGALMQAGAPVLFVTAYANRHLNGAWSDAARLDKPFHSRELIDRVRRLFPDGAAPPSLARH